MAKNIAKLAAPRSQAWINREPQFHLLDQLLEHSIGWIAAPAGAGKTVLAASYLQERGRSTLWYNLDSGDTDPASFFFYLRQAAERFKTSAKPHLPPLTPDYLPGLDLFASAFFREFYRVFGRDGGVLVLDNIQDVEQSPPFLQSLAAAAREVPPGVSLLCISRSAPPPVLSRLTLNRTMAILREDALRWSVEETRQLAQRLGAGALGDDVVNAIHEKTQGWSAGLVLLLAQAAEHTADTAPPGAEQTFFNYFASEIMARLPDGDRQFLYCTALLPAITAAAAASLTDADDAAERLSYLVAQNYFTVKLEATVESYRYHPLFREFLLRQLTSRLSPAALEQLRRRAANLLVENGEHESAVPLLIEASAWPSLAAVIHAIAPELIAHGRQQCLLAWLDAVPQAALVDNPWLMYWKAAALMPIELLRSHELFAEAFAAMQRDDDQPGMAMAWAGAVETIVHSLSHTERLFGWMDKLTMMQRQNLFDRVPELQALVAPQAAAICALHGKMAAPLEGWIPFAESLLSSPLDPSQRVLASFALVTYFHWSGQEHRTLPILSLQASILASGVATPLAVIVTKLCRAWFSWTYGEFEQCAKAVDEGLEISAKSGVQHWVFLLLVQGAANALLRNDLHEAERLLKRMTPLYSNAREMDRVYYHNELGRLELLRGQAERALREQLIAMDKAYAVGAAYVIAETSFGLSQAYHAIGQPDLAVRYLTEARHQAERYGAGQSLTFQCGLIESYYSLSAGDRTAAVKILASTLSQARRLGYTAFGWWRQDVIAQLCHLALTHDIEPDFTRNLIRQYQLLPPAEAMGDSRWPWPVRITTFGQFLLVVNDEVVTFDRKAQKRPLELLKMLIAFGGCDISEAKIIDALWPDADGDAAHRSLITNVHRLRKLLGIPEALVVHDGKLTLDSRYVWLDTWSLEHLLGRIENDEFDGEDLDEMIHRMFNRYCGAFLASEKEAPWALGYRERLRSRVLRGVETLAHRAGAAGRCELVIRLYRMALDIDDLMESYYQGLMGCYLAQNRRAEAQSIYERATQVFASVGIIPSPATKALAARIAASGSDRSGLCAHCSSDSV